QQHRPKSPPRASKTAPTKIKNHHEWLEDGPVVPIMVGHSGSVIPGGDEDTGSDVSSESDDSEDEEKKDEDDMPSRTFLRHGHDRASLVKSHLKKPKISVRKLNMLLRWINILRVWAKPLDLATVHIDIRKPAISNIEQALSVIWRYGRVNNSRVPSALDIYAGKTDKITVMFGEIFDVYVMRTLKKKIVPDMLTWINIILKQYGRPLKAAAMRAPYPGLYQHFTSGVSIFNLIFHFMGTSEIRTSRAATQIDPKRLYEHPMNLSEYRNNSTEIFAIIKALRIDCFWEPDEFINFHDTDFLLLQLYKIYNHFVDMRCALPPAHGDITGVTADGNGEPVVVNMHHKQRGHDISTTPISGDVLVGDGRNQTLRAPVVVKDASTLPAHLPPGLVCASTFEQPRISDEAPLPNMFAEGRHQFLGSADKRRKSFAILSAADTFVVEKDTSAAFYAPEENYTTGAGASEGNSAEVESALRNLDFEFDQAERALEEKEKQLEKAYTNLTDQEHSLQPTVYNKMFVDLDNQMEELARERKAMEDSYVTKRSILKSTPSAANLQIAGSPSSPRSPRKKSPTKQDKGFEEKRKVRAEQGWISATKKAHTHNHDLRNRQKQSEARIRKAMTRENGTSFALFEEGDTRHISETLFEKFAEKIRVKQDAWLEKKEQGAMYKVKRLKEERKIRPKDEPKAIKASGELGEAMTAIRIEELRLMTLEEERRQMVIHQEFKSKQAYMQKAVAERARIAGGGSPIKSPRKESIMAAEQNRLAQQTQLRAQMERVAEEEEAAHVTKDPVADARSALERMNALYNQQGGSNSPMVEEQQYQQQQVQPMADGEALPWLMERRNLIIKERNSERQFEFSVVNGSSVAPNDPTRANNYALQWGNKGNISGFISVIDIAEIKQANTDPSNMIIILKKPNAQAVRNSGGLQMLCIRTNSFPDCTKYRTGLQALMENSA
ncbi:hypothetical protein TL16_g12088, partial [Triparma laevis f. inornata]